MKKITQLVVLLLLISTTQLFAQPKEKTVVVGTFAMEKNAQRTLTRLKETFALQPEIIELQKSANFGYTARKSGLYYIVAIEPIVEYDVLNTILSSARDIFADAFVNIMAKDIEVEITDDGYSVDETEELEAHKQEILLEAEEKEARAISGEEEEIEQEDINEDVTEEDEEESDEADDSEDAIEDIVEDTESASYVQAETSSNSVDNESIYMYAGILILLLLFIVVLIKRKKAKKSDEDSNDNDDLSNIILDDTKKEESVVVEESVVEDAFEPTHEMPSFEDEVVEIENEVSIEETPVEEPPAPKVVSRKRREKNISRGKIQKSDFNKFEGTRILIAEDNLINQKVIMGLLGDSGMELVIAEDGQITLDILADDKNFEMVLMDAHMPNVDGFEATRAIRADASLEHITVVALSGDTSVDDIRKMNDAGMEETLEKPLKMDALYDIFYSYLRLDDEDESPEPDEVVEVPVVEESITEEDDEPYENSVIDHEIGLDIAGDEELYQEIMDEFASTYHESDTQIFEMIQEDNFVGALALLLDIQGLAGSIGAGELYECATMYRVAITEGNTEKMEKMQNQYSKDFLAVVAQIEAHKA